MFWNKTEREQSLQRQITDNEVRLRREEGTNEIQMNELRSEKDIEIKKLQAEISMLKDKEGITFRRDKEIDRLIKVAVDLEKQVAVLQVEKTMLEKMVDIDSDIIDVQELVKQVVAKLPEIRIDGSFALAGGKKDGK